MIRTGGGRVFDHRTLSLVAAKDKAFAVCPLSLLSKDRLQLAKECPDFKLGAPLCTIPSLPSVLATSSNPT